MARVATRSPGFTPIFSSACASFLESRAMPAQLVRLVVPSAQAVTISRAAMLALGMVDQPHDAQRKILHRAERDSSAPPPRGARIMPQKCQPTNALEGQLESRRQRQAARASSASRSAAAASALAAGVVDRGGDQILDHRLLRRAEQALVDVDAEDPALGGGADLDQPAARRRPRPRSCRDCPAPAAARPGRSAPFS